MRYKKGYVLVIVLLILAVTTAAMIQFASTVYGYVNTASNFNESERMSLLLKSAYRLSAGKVLDLLSQVPSQREISFEEKIEDTTVGLLLEDNNSKFNVTLLVSKITGTRNERAYDLFKRLLRELKINEDYADRLVDFIVRNKGPKPSGGQDRAKNYALFSLSELSYIFPEDDLKMVRPYLTVFGDGKININTVDLPVLKVLHKDITEALAKRIIEKREDKPFATLKEVYNFPDLDKFVGDISDIIMIKSTSFNLLITAERNDLVETAEAGFYLSGSWPVLTYWRER